MLLLSNYCHIKSYATLRNLGIKLAKSAKNELAAKGLKMVGFG